LGDGVRPATLSIRVATIEDVPWIVELVESAYRGDASRVGWTTEADLLDGQRTDVAAVADAIGDESSVVLLSVEASGRLNACCQLDRRADGRTYFGMFAVRPEAQGSGIGGNVLASAERYAHDELAARVLEMTVIGQRSELIAWYERRGYRRSGESRPFPYGDERFGVPRRDDLHFVVLAKNLEVPALMEYDIDDDPARIDLDVVWAFLSTSAYWGKWRDRRDVERQIASAWRVVGCYHRDDGMVGFARAISDGVALAYLADVFVLPEHRGRGLGKRVVVAMIDDGPGADFRWLLHTDDAHDLYRTMGFQEPDRTFMERPSRR
jgi:GNAT superfamily N-acetyltransferase